jgi:1-pyrroline-5-carboxylate dehydrogenase
MSNAYFKIPEPINDPVRSYAPGSPDRALLKETLASMQAREIEVPIMIGGQEIKTGNTAEMRAPHDHDLKLGVYHKAGEKEVNLAIEAALDARSDWAAMPWEHRASIILRAADLLTAAWRPVINAATMLGQSKTVYQAEIDSACEIVDFWRFNAYFMAQIMADQPISGSGMWNRVEYRPLEGFVFAVSPFNFTSIAANLPTAPAMVGNVTVWKPASSSVYSNYYIYQLLREAGMPDGVINFVPGSGGEVGNPVMASPDLAGIHFTGSTAVFQGMWKTVGDTIHEKKYYPRIVGETGGKDFIFAHSSANVDALVTAAVRGAFEFQGQKCSAASRLYAPRSIWAEFKRKYVAEVGQIRMGGPSDFTNFMTAVIDRGAFRDITGYIEYARTDPDSEIITGGGYDDSKGWFIEPTTVVTSNPLMKTMCEEIFGPVLTIYVYEDDKLDETLALCNETSPYALTGAVFAQDRYAVVKIADFLRNAAGNFYINDKPTGAVVGQQPFGGGRASGTNDKAGSATNMTRWMSVRTIKETLDPPTDWRYPFMEAD